ncbi:arrestin [Colletotrichum costaricense]|uniref:Arrestin n=1 Tax=Colletotrichum costaricense TaxID=1209916 RepID=A0AAJ0E4Z2_9PEZI|nr:arrestin [Colletotrichum costaricense]KAK1534381.1 arrestin [Colletotrichum costaricense]
MIQKASLEDAMLASVPSAVGHLLVKEPIQTKTSPQIPAQTPLSDTQAITTTGPPTWTPGSAFQVPYCHRRTHLKCGSKEEAEPPRSPQVHSLYRSSHLSAAHPPERKLPPSEPDPLQCKAQHNSQQTKGRVQCPSLPAQPPATSGPSTNNQPPSLLRLYGSNTSEYSVQIPYLEKAVVSTPSTLKSPSSVCHLHDSIRNPPLIPELPWPDLTERASRVAASVATAAAAYACLGKIDAEARISCISPAAPTQNLGALFSCFTLLRYTSRATLWPGLRGLVSAGHCSRFFFFSTPHFRTLSNNRPPVTSPDSGTGRRFLQPLRPDFAPTPINAHLDAGTRTASSTRHSARPDEAKPQATGQLRSVHVMPPLGLALCSCCCTSPIAWTQLSGPHTHQAATRAAPRKHDCRPPTRMRTSPLSSAQRHYHFHADERRILDTLAIQPPRIEGKVEIRPSQGYSMPVSVSLVRICLQRRETIHPAAENVAKRHLGTPRRETTDVVGKELLLFRCQSGKDAESVIAMDLPFVLFIPFGRGGEETNRRIPPASLQLPSRTAETYYELVVTVQQGHTLQNKYSFPIPLQRYDTLSTFGMYNKPESRQVSDASVVTLGISVPKWSYGPLDPITVYIKLVPNPDWMKKALKVTIQKITVTIEEEITYNPEGDEPTKKVNKVAKNTQLVNTKMPEAGYATNLGLVFPSKDLRDPDGIIRRGKPAFPLYEVTSFTTSSTLYKIEFYLTVKAQLGSTRDLTVRQPLVICPMDQQACKEEMDAIEQAAKDASHVDPNNPMLPARAIVLANDRESLKTLGLCLVGGQKKPLIE